MKLRQIITSSILVLGVVATASASEKLQTITSQDSVQGIANGPIVMSTGGIHGFHDAFRTASFIANNFT